MVECEVPLGEGTTVAHLFSQLEQARDELDLADYSVSQTTLDQVRP
jgi:hypothetical protein